SAAGATWSVVAVDPETGEVGAAIASCVPGDILGEPTGPLVPVALVPGVGAGVSQGQLDVGAPGRIIELLETGSDPAAVVDDLTDPERDALFAVRQHAVVAAVDGPAASATVAAHTGAELSAAALDRQGDGVSVQGNLLVADAVVDDALGAYASARAADGALADALVDALVAGARAGGDRRCGDQTALFAQVVVAGPDDDPTQPTTVLTVLVADGDGRNPVEELATAWSEGRRGLIDLDQPSPAGGRWFRIAVFVVAGAMVGGAVLAFARGLGAVSARRTSPPS
ncbi:MAG: DUF1028 domain-containing protein, partial [Actinomycetota bacterium]